MTNGTRGLPVIVTLLAALATAAGMAVYAFVQWVVHPGLSPAALFWEHLWHVLALTPVFLFLYWLLLDRLVAIPLRGLGLHLYGVAAGQLNEIELPTRVREIRDIVRAANLMIRRMSIGVDHGELRRWRHAFAEIRELVRRLPPDQDAVGAAILDRLSLIEEGVLTVVREQSRP